MNAPEPPFTTKERLPASHSSTIKTLGYSPRCFAASNSIRPGNAVHVEMPDSGWQTATIGGRVRWRNQDLFLTVAHPFQEQLPNAHVRAEKKAPSENLSDVGCLYYSADFDGNPELNYALIRPGPDVHMEDDVELFPSPCHRLLQFPRFTSEEDFEKINRQTPVRSVTASAGAVVGELDPMPTFLLVPWTSSQQKVYEVKFNVLVALKDAGAWVFNASNNRLLGYIMTGIPGAGVAVIVPAYKVFDELAKPYSGR